MNSITQLADSAAPIIVGVGASAGGLEAFQLFLKGLPDNHNLVVILVQHLDPDHESLMPELVAAKTKSPVHSVTDHMQVEAGHIYLIPPGYEMEIDGTTLRLKRFETPRGLRRPIDGFFFSLAKSHGENAIAVVLSGTGSDGSKGAREVKGAGGLVFVQDPKQAKYDGMPQSVLDLNCADVVSKAEEVFDVVGDYFHIRVGVDGDIANDDEFLDRILRHVRFRTGHDFTDYKKATILRRVAVRMSVLNITSRSEYLKHIAEKKPEANLLFRDLLINVTSFFRDPSHFEVLEKEIIPELFADPVDREEIRVWVAGCSTGEEAYSIAILLAEQVERTQRHCRVIVFGTDIDEAALAVARNGRYPDSIVDSVPALFLERYFRPTNEGFEVGSRLREMVRFSRHSFIKDPPFSKLDLVSCRNVMIYFQDQLQELAVRVFHYALMEGSYLFIGPSENPKLINEHFAEVSNRARIFRRRPGTAKPLNLGSLSGAVLPTEGKLDARKIPGGPDTDIRQILLDSHVPAHLHADQNNKVIYASENATRYLAVRAGKMDTDLFKLIAPELETTIRRASRVDVVSGSREEREFQGEVNGEMQRLVVIAERLEDGTILYVIHDKLMLNSERFENSDDGAAVPDAYVIQLETELDTARQAVRTTVEELDTSNEELKSSNEEMMSMNEELQSANEELTTINDELQEKLRELAQANKDLENFMLSAKTATVFLDGDLKLRTYSPEALEYFSFSSSDVGRPLADLNATIDQDRVIELCRLTIDKNAEHEEEFASKDDEVHLAARFMPYTPDESGQIGAVFTLQNVTELRDLIESAEAARAVSEERLAEVEQIYASSPMAMGLIDKDMRYVRLNEQLAAINGEPLDLHPGRRIRDVIPTVADQTEGLIQKVIDSGKPVKAQQITGSIRSDPGNERVWEADFTPLFFNGEVKAVSVTVRDMTDEIRTSEKLRELMAELEHRVKNMLSNVIALLNQARREVSGDDEVYRKLVKRIEGLAATHSLLTSERWSSAPIRDVFVPETTAIYGEERVTLRGPDIRVNSQVALSLGMAIHELATNAAKYGALSKDDGQVTLTWSRINDAESDRLRFEWREENGPAVNEPQKEGFGSRLIRSLIQGALGGQIVTQWNPSGISQVFEMDYERVTEDGEGLER